MIVFARALLDEDAAVKERAESRSTRCQIEQELAEARAEVQTLQFHIQDVERVAAAQPQRSTLSMIQAYRHAHEGTSIPLRRGRKTLRITALRDDGVGCVVGQGILPLRDEDLEQMRVWMAAQTGTSPVLPATGEHEHQALRQRVEELEAERAEWMAWKDVQIMGSGSLSSMQQYLHDHLVTFIPVRRNGVVLHIVALGNDAVAVTEGHGLVRLNDDELEQGRIWVAKKCGQPVIATRLPIGVSRKQGQQFYQIEQELAEAQAATRAAQRELSKYLPAPRGFFWNVRFATGAQRRRFSSRTKRWPATIWIPLFAN